MANTSFHDLPSVELLQWLARGSLKQNLLRAVRLWVWLDSLYGEGHGGAALAEPFSFAAWRSTFFSASHPTGEAVPLPHDPHCRCAKSTAQWLFSEQTGISPPHWQRSLQQHDAQPDNLAELLEQPLFRVTRRTLYEDLQILHKLGWVQRRGQDYYRVRDLPNRPQSPQPSSSGIVSPDLAAIADNLAQQINGWQRFFLHVEYIVPKGAIDRVDDWQAALRQVWEQTPVPPVQLAYDSAALQQQVSVIVYPVCLYYMQRAPYLCAWGQLPHALDAIGWRNYRLDRIQSLITLSWQDSQLPAPLWQAHQSATLPTPDLIQQRLEEAWGFDFYQPSAPLLLRFDRQFHAGYIQNTVRHATFEQISYAQAGKLIERCAAAPAQRQALLAVWRSRSPQDAYYQAQLRLGDPNVMLRLRAWRPKGEVLLPYNLRQQVAAEVQREALLYQGF